MSARSPGQLADPAMRPAELVRRPVPGPAPSPRHLKHPHAARRDVWVASVLLAVTIGIGYGLSLRSAALLHNRMLPWILGRSLGVASYVALSALVVLGIWFRHPWRVSRRTPSPGSLLRAHASLAACTVTLLAGHVTALALDRFSGVGWTGVLVPWHAQYRPTAVALGSLALYGIALVAGTAALAGSIARRVWLPVHSLSSAVFAASLAHGLLAGSDSRSLLWVYVVSGLLVASLQLTRLLARPLGALETW